MKGEIHLKRQYTRVAETVERERELYFNEIKNAILEIIYALLNIQIMQKNRSIKLVSILDTGWYCYLFVV